jgi:hypothetical protein
MKPFGSRPSTTSTSASDCGGRSGRTVAVARDMPPDKAAAVAILAWAVEGALAYQREGLRPIERVEAGATVVPAAAAQSSAEVPRTRATRVTFVTHPPAIDAIDEEQPS